VRSDVRHPNVECMVGVWALIVSEGGPDTDTQADPNARRAMCVYVSAGDAPVMGPLLRASRKGGALTDAGLTARAINERMRELGVALGLAGLSAHDLRHYWAVRKPAAAGRRQVGLAGDAVAPTPGVSHGTPADGRNRSAAHSVRTSRAALRSPASPALGAPVRSRHGAGFRRPVRADSVDGSPPRRASSRCVGEHRLSPGLAPEIVSVGW
jgi:hypothetical protein